MLEQIGSVASILGFLKEPMDWIRRSLVHKAVRIETVMERGPSTRRSGFTEPAVKIIVMNESKRSIKIRDIRLMFCDEYGASVAPEAPEERSHPELPMDLDSGKDEHWYIPADKLFALLSVCQKTPLSELSCHDPPHFPRQLQPNFVQEDASDRSGWGDWWWTGPDLRDAAIGRRSRLLGSGFKG